MTKYHKRIEIIFYLVAFALALVVRFYHLGAVPLTDAEAAWAFQAFQLANPKNLLHTLTIGNQTAYVNLTGVLFYLLFDNNFLARMLPAIAGSFLVWIPFIFKDKLGNIAAIFAAFGLAIDAGLVATSRTIGSPILAVTFGFFAFAFFYKKKPLLAGMLIGLTLLSGTFALIMIIVFGLSWVIINQFENKPSPPIELELNSAESIEQENHDKPPFSREQWSFAGISFGFTILIVGSVFFMYPQGISAIFNNLPFFIRGWIEPAGISATQIIAALVFYAPIPIVFSIYQIITQSIQKKQSNKSFNNNDIYLSAFTLISFFFILFYPGRETSYLAIILVPLWLIAGRGFQESIKGWKVNGIIAAHSVFIFIIMALFWFSLISHSNFVGVTQPYLPLLRASVLTGVILIGIFSTILISMGWGTDTARFGVIYGTLTGLLVYTISVMWGASQLRPTQPEELWYKQPGSGQATLFQKTLSDLSNWNTGLPESVEILSLVDTPSMQWELRNFNNTRFEKTISPVSLPPIIITLENEATPVLSSAYRGQDFVWWIHAGWMGALPPDFISWFTFRKVPLNKEKVILWAREDLFPKGGEIFTESQAP